MKKILVAVTLTFCALAMALGSRIDQGASKGRAFAADLIISEYVEGTSNNKAIEIYNGTGVSVDLSTYSLKKQSNGVGDFIGPVVINRTLAHNATFVLANSLATFPADTLLAYATNATLSFNGNDAVGLFKTVGGTETMIDVVGIVNDASNWGPNMTLVRNSSITSPSATYNVADWTQYPTDTFSYLGAHTMNLTPVTTAEISATPVSLNFGDININEVSLPKIVKIYGKNLTDNITVTAPAGFGIGTTESDLELDPTVTLNQTSGIVDTTSLFIRFVPTVEQTYTGNLVCNSTGAANVNIALSGAGTGSTSNFATDLIISEYVEGTSNNKAIEIYNGTGAPVDLSAYAIKKQSNGAGDFMGPVVINRTLAHNATFVLANSLATFPADTLLAYEINATLSFNGNDAVGLFKTVGGTETMIDVVGIVNDASNWGPNMTLVRNSSITSPSATYNVADWTQYPTDTFSYLGAHTMNLTPVTTPEITATPAALSFGSLDINEMSSPKMVKIYGKNLTDNIVVTVPAGFGIGTTESDIELDSIITLNHAAGIVDTTAIFIRFIPKVEQNYNGNLVCTSAEAIDKNIALTGVGLATNVIGFVDFEDGSFASMTTYSADADSLRKWKIASFGANSTTKCAEMNGYQETSPNNDWMITPCIDFDALKNESISFYTQWKYGTVDTELSFKYSSNYSGSGDPTTATWIDLPFTKPATADVWELATIDLTTIIGDSVYMAFNYQSNGLSRWRVDEIKFVGEDLVSIAQTNLSKSLELTSYPNPFNPATTILFNLPTALQGQLSIYNVKGEKVANLFSGEFKAGANRYSFNATSLNSGVYYCKLTAGNQTYTKKMILVK